MSRRRKSSQTTNCLCNLVDNVLRGHNGMYSFVAGELQNLYFLQCHVMNFSSLFPTYTVRSNSQLQLKGRTGSHYPIAWYYNHLSCGGTFFLHGLVKTFLSMVKILGGNLEQHFFLCLGTINESHLLPMESQHYL